MSRRFTKKRVVAAVSVVATLAIAAAAFAYWTTTGSGTGTGTVGSDAARTVSGTIAAGLAPGGDAAVTLTANRDSHTTYKIGAITGSVAVDATHVTAGCSASDFAFTGPTADETVEAQDGTNGTTKTLTSGNVHMLNSSSNQDACKGATLTISLSAAAPATP